MLYYILTTKVQMYRISMLTHSCHMSVKMASPEHREFYVMIIYGEVAETWYTLVNRKRMLIIEWMLNPYHDCNALLLLTTSLLNYGLCLCQPPKSTFCLRNNPIRKNVSHNLSCFMFWVLTNMVKFRWFPKRRTQESAVGIPTPWRHFSWNTSLGCSTF